MSPEVMEAGLSAGFAEANRLLIRKGSAVVQSIAVRWEDPNILPIPADGVELVIGDFDNVQIVASDGALIWSSDFHALRVNTVSGQVHAGQLFRGLQIRVSTGEHNV